MPARNRRHFLKAGAALGTTLVAVPALSASPPAATGSGSQAAVARPARRTLGSGKHSIEVSSLGLGCMGMSYHRSFIPERNVSIAVVRKAIEPSPTYSSSVWEPGSSGGFRNRWGVFRRRTLRVPRR